MQAKQGLVEFRVNDASFVMNAIGNKSFTDEDLQRNLKAYLEAIAGKRPGSLKGKYLGKATIKSTYGSPVKLDITPYQSMVSN